MNTRAIWRLIVSAGIGHELAEVLETELQSHFLYIAWRGTWAVGRHGSH